MIFFVRQYPNPYGGKEKYLSRLIDLLQKEGKKHGLIESSIPRFFPSWLKIILFNIQVCLFKKGNFLFSLERISCPDIFRAGDGVHKHFVKIEEKSYLNPLHSLTIFFEKRSFFNSKKVIANSKMVKREILHYYDIPSEKVEVIYNGIDTKEYCSDRAKEDLSSHFPIAGKTIFLVVGSGFKRKGVKEFLLLLSKLNIEDYFGFVVGGDKNLDTYKKIALELGIEKNIAFTGKRKDIGKFYSISDFFILPSHYDPFSNAVLEAMINRNIVFTTEQNGAHEILEDGFIMNDSNDLSIIDLINKIIANKKLMDIYKQRNYEVAMNFTIENNLEQTFRLIQEIS